MNLFHLCFDVKGTPIQNNLEELYAVVQFVCPGYLGSLLEFQVVTNTYKFILQIFNYFIFEYLFHTNEYFRNSMQI